MGLYNSNTNVQSPTNKSRVDKFLLVFDLPPILKNISRKIIRDIDTIQLNSVQFSIFGSMVPEIVVPAVETRYAGSTLYVSSHNKNSYPPVQVKFKIDNEYNNYWTIYNWINLLHDDYQGIYNADNLTVDNENFEDYITDLTIYGKDENNENRIKFNYTKAFPTSIDTISYNYQEEEEILSGFTFVYSQMHVDLL